MTDETHDGERGQVGIGTLIVFIAMVLVAAIAAGVLINTAGFLQSKSEQTGEESGQQVTNRLVEVNAVGQVTANDPGEVGVVNVTVSKAAGADDIALNNVTVQWVDDTGTYDVVSENADTSSADGAFAINGFKDADGSSPVINDPDDRIVMTFDLGTNDYYSSSGNEFGETLKRGDTASLSITTMSGAASDVRVSVPDSLTGVSGVAL